MARTTKREYLEKIRCRYRPAGQRYKSKIPDEFFAVCGDNRKYAIGLLGQRFRGPRKKLGPKGRYGPDAVLRTPLWRAGSDGAPATAWCQRFQPRPAVAADPGLISARHKRCSTKPGSLLKQDIERKLRRVFQLTPSVRP